MGDGTTENSPLTEIDADFVLEHYRSGNGSDVFVDMQSHLTTGGGRVFSLQNFASDIKRAVDDKPIGTVVRFETNRELQKLPGVEKAVYTYDYYKW